MPAFPAGEPEWAVLVPAHNERQTIREVVEGALRHVGRVIVVDDGSTDGTADALAGLDVTIIRHEENRGKGIRLAEGLAHAVAAGADGVITLDADGQHDPEDIPAFIDAARAAPGALVVGDRFADRDSIPSKRYASICFGDWWIGIAAGQPIRDAQCGMRLYPARLVREVNVPPDEREHFTYETSVLIRAARAGLRIVRVPIAARYEGFQQRPSHYRPALDTMRITRVVSRHVWRNRLHPRRLLIALNLIR